MPIAAVEPTPQRLSSERALIIWFSAAALLIHLLTNRGYGYFRDELYYMACGQHLDFGYVDLPPLSALLIRLSRVLFGDSLFAIRLLPALAGAGTVALTGVITRELGGRRWAVALGCTASLFAVVFLANGNFFSMNAFEPLFWMGCIYLLVRIINGGSPHLWLLFGVLAGLGVENKHSTVFFGAGILVALLLTPERRRFSKKWIWLGGLIAFAIAYLVTLAEFIVMHGKHYYLAPAYPMLFAAGGVAAERLFAARLRWLKPALLSAVIVIGTLLTPIALPILSPEKLVAYMKAIHFEPPRTETSHTAALPQHFADRFGWKEMVRSVARAYHSLPSYDQKRAAIFCQNYGQAGAIDFFGPKYGLPPAISGHQNYFVWGPRDYTGDVVLVLDDRADDEREQFESVEDLGPMESSPWAMPWEQRNHIFLCRNLKGGLKELWPNLKTWM